MDSILPYEEGRKGRVHNPITDATIHVRREGNDRQSTVKQLPDLEAKAVITRTSKGIRDQVIRGLIAI